MASVAQGLRPRQLELKLNLGTNKQPPIKIGIGIFWTNALLTEIVGQKHFFTCEQQDNGKRIALYTLQAYSTTTNT